MVLQNISFMLFGYRTSRAFFFFMENEPSFISKERIFRSKFLSAKLLTPPIDSSHAKGTYSVCLLLSTDGWRGEDCDVKEILSIASELGIRCRAASRSDSGVPTIQWVATGVGSNRTVPNYLLGNGRNGRAYLKLQSCTSSIFYVIGSARWYTGFWERYGTTRLAYAGELDICHP